MSIKTAPFHVSSILNVTDFFLLAVIGLSLAFFPLAFLNISLYVSAFILGLLSIAGSLREGRGRSVFDSLRLSW